MTPDPWPPEGTRVRIPSGRPNITGKYVEGVLAGNESWVDNWLHFVEFNGQRALFERHEIEVIDDVRTE